MRRVTQTGSQGDPRSTPCIRRSPGTWASWGVEPGWTATMGRLTPPVASEREGHHCMRPRRAREVGCDGAYCPGRSFCDQRLTPRRIARRVARCYTSRRDTFISPCAGNASIAPLCPRTPEEPEKSARRCARISARLWSASTRRKPERIRSNIAAAFAETAAAVSSCCHSA